MAASKETRSFDEKKTDDGKKSKGSSIEFSVNLSSMTVTFREGIQKYLIIA